MSAQKNTSNDYRSLTAANKDPGAGNEQISTLKPPPKIKQGTLAEKDADHRFSLVNPSANIGPKEALAELPAPPEIGERGLGVEKKVPGESIGPLSFAEEQKLRKRQKTEEKDRKLLDGDRWIYRNGHNLTYIGLFLFTFVVYFRPYEWIPDFQSFTSLALIFAVATLLIYLPTQLATEGSLTILTTEVKCLIFLGFWSLLTMPIAKDPGTAWKVFNETFSKIIIIFIVAVNTLRTLERLRGLMWLSVGVGVFLSFQALSLYSQSKFEVEGYRVNVDYGGMFGNPNDMALHLVMFTPVAIALGIISKNKLGKLAYFSAAGLMVMANMVTQSRGGFLGLIAIFVIMVWKFSKRNRLMVIGSALLVGALVITLAPGNYWLRILSIFIPSLDAVGSSDQRRELLERSIQVSLRNPLGIGLGNFPIVGVRNLETHNAFTQVSSELGWLGITAFLTFIVSPLRKLWVVERQIFSRQDSSWIYYLAIGVQASIVGFIVSGFFVSVAYQWFIYYPIAYAVCLRRIYNIRQKEKGETGVEESGISELFKR
jgi:putative inorganic carbon (HCO3(-)) transporter